MVDIRWPPNVPESEISCEFIQGMADRMAMSYLRYGFVAVAFPTRVDALASLLARLEKYRQTGNTEYLIDVANFAMIEFMHPSHPSAHYTPTDRSGSPGRKWHGEVDPSHRSNDPSTWRDE